MRKLATIILMMCLSCQLVLKLSIITWFEINQDYIAATLCENKDKPELVCCGKCVLTKKLNKVDAGSQKDKGTTPTKTDKTSIVAFILPDSDYNNKAFTALFVPIQNSVIPHHFDVAVHPAIFHPPTIIYS